MSNVETYQQEIMDAIDDAMLMIHEHNQEIDRWNNAPFADSNDLELLRIHINTIEKSIQALRAQIVPVSGCWYCTGIESHSIATVKTVKDEYGRELGAYDTPYNYCPDCGYYFGAGE